MYKKDSPCNDCPLQFYKPCKQPGKCIKDKLGKKGKAAIEAEQPKQLDMFDKRR